MAISTQPFTTIVSNMATAIQGAANSLIDFTVGSVLRAFTEAVAAIALWLQGIALQIAALTRFSTSSGADADSWGADYDFPRLPAQPATGAVSFTRFTATAQATIAVCSVNPNGSVNPDGTIVQTQDGTEQYGVVADTTQAAYSAALNVYVIPAGIATIAATVTALTAGSSSNVASQQINTLGSSIPGVDSVVNPLAFDNGDDAESDASYKARFPAYIASLSKATPTAVGEAITAIQQGLTFSLTENQNPDGSANPGFFFVVVDDGTGHPSSTLLATVANAIDAVRPIGSTFAVFGPSLVSANIAMTIATGSGFTHATVVAQVIAAINAYINGLSVGVTLPYTRLAQVAYDASAGVQNVTAVTLNGGTSDLSTSSQQVVRVGSVSVI